MISKDFPQSNLILGAGQSEYEPIYAHKGPGPQVPIVTPFRLGPDELEEIARTGTIWITQLTFGDKFHPIALSTRDPFRTENT